MGAGGGEGMSTWLFIEDGCRNCGGVLEARYAPVIGLEYRHVETESRSCTVTYKAEPFSEWSAIKSYKKAEKGLSILEAKR